METKIKEVQDYFVQKIVSGDYELENFSHPVAKILIDKKYNFSLWTANGYTFFETYALYPNFIPLEFTNEQKEIAHKVIHEKIQEDLEARTIAEIQQLENKIENLKKSL